MESADDARRGGLADLVTTDYPEVRLSDVTLAPATRAQLERVLQEQRQRDRIESHGFVPLHRLLFTGPAGTGKSMTASAMATELSLPLVTIRIETLISRYTGETPAKLRVAFDALAYARTVCLFEDLDVIAARQVSWNDNGIVDARRILDMFLSFLDHTQPESVIVAVTDQRSVLDDALLRRFDATVAFALPDTAHALALLRRRLAAVNTSAVSWEEVGNHVKGLSQAGLVRAAESAAKRAILHEGGSVSTAALVTGLDEFRGTHHVTGFSRSRLPCRFNLAARLIPPRPASRPRQRGNPGQTLRRGCRHRFSAAAGRSAMMQRESCPKCRAITAMLTYMQYQQSELANSKMILIAIL